MKKMLFFTLIFTLWILTIALSAATISDNAENPFIENAGQHNFGILFSVGVPGGTATVSQNNDISYRIGSTTFTEKFEFLRDSSFKGIEKSNAAINIYKENFTASGIPAFKSLSAGNEGVVLTLKSSAGTFEKIFTVNPGTDPCSIKISVTDADLIENIRDMLVIHTGNGTASFTSPVAWQETETGKQNIEVAYVTNGKSYGFTVGNYDHELPLFIDPLLAGVFIGGNNSDEAIAINVVANGDIVIAGSTFSNDFPVTDSSTYKNEEHSDCVIMKYDPSGTTLKAAAYFGGSRSECSATDIDDDETNMTKTYFAGLTTIGEEVFLVSTTYSPDLPVTDEAYDKTCGTDGNCNDGQADAFIAKFNEQLVLEAATYYGGSGQDRGRAGIVQNVTFEGHLVFIAGDSNSIDLPSSMPFGGGDYDAFVASFTNDLKTLNISRMIGGNNRDRILAITSDQSRGIYITGITGSSNFPVTKDGNDKTLGSGGMGDVFVSNLDFYTLNMDYSTLFGGNWTDYGYAIDFDFDGSVYVAGATYSEPRDGFPVTAGAYKTTATTRTDNNSNWRTEGFIAKLSLDLSTLEASTYLGSSEHDDIKGIAALNGEVVVAGFTDSTEFPVTENAFDTTHGGGWDGFISVLSSDLTALRASTFIGGTGEDRLFVVSFDAFENPVSAGFTTSTEIPGINGVKNGSNEMIFLRIAPDLKDSPDEGVLVALDFIDFGEIVVESSSWPRPVQLRNVGGAALNISAIDLDDTVNFSLNFGNYLFSCSPGISIAAGTYCLLEISMAPQVLGTIEGTITVSSDAGPDLEIHLTGIGKEYQDTGDSGTDTVGDSGDTGNTGDTGDSGNTGDTGDTGDTTTDNEKSDDETDLPKTKESGCSTIII